MRRQFWGLIAALLWPTCAFAEVVNLDTISVDIALPPGYCKLSRDIPQEKKAYDQQDRMQQGKNVVIALAVPCGERNSTTGFSKWAIWLQTGASPAVIPPGMTRSEIVNQIAKTIPTLDVQAIGKAVGERSKDTAGIDLQLNKAGLIDRDDTAYYVSALIDASQGNVKRNIAVVYAMTTLSGRLYSFNLYRDFESTKTIEVLLTEVKDVMARSIAGSDAIKIDKTLPKGMQ